MKLLALIAGLILIPIVAVGFVRLAQRRQAPPVVAVPKPMTLEEKLAALDKCGLKLSPPFTIKDVLAHGSRELYEAPGYDFLLTSLGSAEELEPARNHCRNLWYFDTEAISDDGDYKKIAERMVELTDGSLKLANIQDHVDLEHNQAWLSFTYKGKPIRIVCQVDNDWVDPAVFGKFVALLKESDPAKIYFYHGLGGDGQDCMIGCVTRSQFECLQSLDPQFKPLA